MAGGTGALDDVPALVTAALTVSDAAAALAANEADMEHCAVLGRGFNQSTAFEWALKIQELTHVVAQPFSTADFLHGPIAVLEPEYPVLAVAARGPAVDDVIAVLERCRDTGASLVVIGNDPRLRQVGPLLEFDPDVEEWLSPIPAAVIGQLFAYQLTVAKGLDPEQPRGLHKVTRTV
jgi:glucosamine--fructose-6-phosphate aminotransferase (isomerizing)